MNLFEALRPWTDVIFEQVPELELFDAHTHLGQNDPDGMKQSADELVSSLQKAGARGAFTFPFHEPDGYREANDAVIQAARQAQSRCAICRWSFGTSASPPLPLPEK